MSFYPMIIAETITAIIIDEYRYYGTWIKWLIGVLCVGILLMFCGF